LIVRLFSTGTNFSRFPRACVFVIALPSVDFKKRIPVPVKIPFKTDTDLDLKGLCSPVALSALLAFQFFSDTGHTSAVANYIKTVLSATLLPLMSLPRFAPKANYAFFHTAVCHFFIIRIYWMFGGDSFP